MSYKEDKFVRFQEWSSDKSLMSNKHFSTEDEFESGRFGSTVSSVSRRIRSGFAWGSKGVKNISKSFHIGSLNESDSKKPRKKVLDPQGPFLQKWNKIFAITCVVAVSMDPLFFYIPVIDGKKNCLDVDRKLEIAACVLRFFTDFFYILHIIFQFRTAFIAPSRVFGRGVLVEDPVAIAKRYLSSYFLIDILAVLPLPQVVILVVIPKLRGSVALNSKNWIRLTVLIQYIPRFLRIYPLYELTA